jgi:hypothetical protein
LRPSFTGIAPNPEFDDRTSYLETDDYSLSIESASGAKGDVVAVTVAIASRLFVPTSWAGINLAICHESTLAELVGGPIFTEEVQSMVTPWGLVTRAANNGLIVGIGFSPNSYNTRFPSEVPLPLMTIYYRLTGEPGSVGQLVFCDGVLDFGPGSCFLNVLEYHTDEPYFYFLRARSNSSGLLTIVEGPATHPEPPTEPPEALIYPEALTPEQANFRVRVTDAVGWPGAQEVPVDLYTASDVEYVGIELPLNFDERYLRLARVENYLKPIVSIINNESQNVDAGAEEGYVVLFSGLGVNNRRIAPAGAEIHVATLYFNVLETASDIDVTAVTVETVGSGAPVNYPSWIGVRHKSGLTPDAAVVQSQVAPVVIINGLLGLRADVTPFLRGDANGDRTVSLSDAVTTLSYLFLTGGMLDCPDAADANDDGMVNIVDPIRTLQFLFVGGTVLPPPNEVAGEDPTPDQIVCSSTAQSP